ncbi:MAG: acyl-CoA desaturase [Candidatus Hydrogenedentota bacterium]|nr:MAG: acyl-CoA desaturase [Candidatus Hydrogenedentota bacterium]
MTGRVPLAKRSPKSTSKTKEEKRENNKKFKHAKLKTKENTRYKFRWTQIPFFLIHLLPLGAFFTGVHVADAIFLAVFYFTGMFFVTAGYHRYFSHKTYKLNRFWQFIFAFMAQATAQKGVLWWASHHRTHHKYSDTDYDIHSAKKLGFFYSHLGWILSDDHEETDYDLVKDLAKYPELVWLNKHPLIPAWIVGITAYLIGGASMLFFGFFLGLVLLWHGTFTINSLTHMFGKQRYVTGDESRNNPFFALITLGEGWHNNHHFFQSSTRQGFFWWEFDITYYILKLLSWVGIVKKMRPVPDHIKYAHIREPEKYSAKLRNEKNQS